VVPVVLATLAVVDSQFPDCVVQYRFLLLPPASADIVVDPTPTGKQWSPPLPVRFTPGTSVRSVCESFCSLPTLLRHVRRSDGEIGLRCELVVHSPNPVI